MNIVEKIVQKVFNPLVRKIIFLAKICSKSFGLNAECSEFSNGKKLRKQFYLTNKSIMLFSIILYFLDYKFQIRA